MLVVHLSAGQRFAFIFLKWQNGGSVATQFAFRKLVFRKALTAHRFCCVSISIAECFRVCNAAVH